MVRAVVRAGSSWAQPTDVKTNEDKLMEKLFMRLSVDRPLMLDMLDMAAILIATTRDRAAYQLPGRGLFIEAVAKSLEAEE